MRRTRTRRPRRPARWPDRGCCPLPGSPSGVSETILVVRSIMSRTNTWRTSSEPESGARATNATKRPSPEIDGDVLPHSSTSSLSSEAISVCARLAVPEQHSRRRARHEDPGEGRRRDVGERHGRSVGGDHGLRRRAAGRRHRRAEDGQADRRPVAPVANEDVLGEVRVARDERLGARGERDPAAVLGDRRRGRRPEREAVVLGRRHERGRARRRGPERGRRRRVDPRGGSPGRAGRAAGPWARPGARRRARPRPGATATSTSTNATTSPVGRRTRGSRPRYGRR